MTKSNPTPARWVTHKLETNYTTEVPPQDWRSWAPCQASQLGCLAMGRGAPRESGFEGQWGLIAGIPQDWGKQKLHSWRAHSWSSAHKDPGKKQWLHKRLGQTYLLVLEGLLQRWGVAVAHCRDKDTCSGSAGKYSLEWTPWRPPTPQEPASQNSL